MLLVSPHCTHAHRHINSPKTSPDKPGFCTRIEPQAKWRGCTLWAEQKRVLDVLCCCIDVCQYWVKHCFKVKQFLRALKSFGWKQYLHSVCGFLVLIHEGQKEELRDLMCTKPTTVKASISAQAVKPFWLWDWLYWLAFLKITSSLVDLIFR